MKHFLIYTNEHKDVGLELTRRIQKYLELKGHTSTIKVKEKDWEKKTDTDEGDITIPSNVDIMLVLGGDGTMLQAARDTKKSRIPILGVNLGTLGYMTEVEPENLEESLDQLLSEDYELESRMMLNAKIKRNEATLEGWALNDIVISRRGSLQIIDLNIYVNGKFLKKYNADGVIITTPTGSTGYNLSAGGPIVDPKAQLMMITPICPHSLNMRSIILSPEDKIVIEIPKGREGQNQEVEASFDGNQQVVLSTGDSIMINKSEKTTDIIKLNKVSFLETLHKKMMEN